MRQAVDLDQAPRSTRRSAWRCRRACRPAAPGWSRRGRRRAAVHGPAGIAVGARSGIGGGLAAARNRGRWRRAPAAEPAVAAAACRPRAPARLAIRCRRAGDSRDRRRSPIRRRAADRMGRHTYRGSRGRCGSGGDRQRAGLATLVGQVEGRKVEPRHVGAAATDHDGKSSNHPCARCCDRAWAACDYACYSSLGTPRTPTIH